MHEVNRKIVFPMNSTNMAYIYPSKIKIPLAFYMPVIYTHMLC